MRLLLLIACLGLGACGYNQPYMEARFARMSDAELIRHNQFVNQGLAPDVNPQAEWTLAEMKRRGLVGPGRDGIPAEGQR